MIGRWITNVRRARWWVKALDLTSKSQFEQALHYADLVECHLDGAVGEVSKYDIYCKLLKGFLLGSLKRNEEALEVLAAVQRDILRVGFMTDELKYLRCYGAVLGHEAMRSIPAKRLPSHAESLLKVDYENVDLAKVLSNVKRTFPLRFHPLWKESNR